MRNRAIIAVVAWTPPHAVATSARDVFSNKFDVSNPQTTVSTYE